MKAIIFDMDGVIIDSEPINIQAEMDMMKTMGFDISIKEMEVFTGVTNTSMWQTLKKRYDLEPSVEDLVDQSNALKKALIRDMEIEPIEGIRELIDFAISKGYKLAVASSSPMDMIELVVNKFGLADVFDALVSGETVPNSKPAPDVFLQAMASIGVTAENCYVIEDSTHGIQAAKASGAFCIGYDNPNSVGQNYDRADMVVHHIKDILETHMID